MDADRYHIWKAIHSLQERVDDLVREQEELRERLIKHVGRPVHHAPEYDLPGLGPHE